MNKIVLPANFDLQIISLTLLGMMCPKELTYYERYVTIENMNYKKIYERLIQRGQTRTLTEYSERHHIVPRCMGGTDDPLNLVRLTAEEHYVAHQLLVKINPGHIGLVNAAMAMTKHTSNRRMNNKLFGWLRKRASLLTTGVPKSEETKQKMRKPKSESHRANISLAQLTNGGNGPEKHSQETKNRIKEWTDENTAFREIVKCPHCGTSGGKGPMSRFHFDNCASIKPRLPMRQISCPHCDVSGGVSVVKQKHFEKCKHKNKELT